MFQHTAARRRLPYDRHYRHLYPLFQHTAARRRLLVAFLFSATKTGFNTQPRGGGCFESICIKQAIFEFQHTAARRRLRGFLSPYFVTDPVSTHSRAEAAAFIPSKTKRRSHGFNTQPRGGGCMIQKKSMKKGCCFNTQPRGGGCIENTLASFCAQVSTHSRAEAAALYIKKQEKSAY